MNKEEKIRLMKKYRVKSLPNGLWGDGFINGLKAADTKKERKPIETKEEIDYPRSYKGDNT